jgi:acetyl esterase/lipase
MPEFPLPALEIWSGSPPDLRADAVAVATETQHPNDGLLLSALHHPTLTIYPAPSDRATGAAAIICPGGGYRVLAVEKEGVATARWLNHHGIAAGVLHYRVFPNHHPAPLRDARRALSLMRARAATHGFDPARIGVLGFSAGGHLAASLSVLHAHPDALPPGTTPESAGVDSSGPAFSLLFYPVISLGAAPVTMHASSRASLLGADPAPALVDLLSLHLSVTPAAPPTFLAHTFDDPTVPVAHARAYYAALRKAGVPAELNDTHSGPHGLGLALDSPHATVRAWSEACAAWLRSRRLGT